MKEFRQFTGPDGETPITRFEQHATDCQCEDCQQERWMQAERDEMRKVERAAQQA